MVLNEGRQVVSSYVFQHGMFCVEFRVLVHHASISGMCVCAVCGVRRVRGVRGVRGECVVCEVMGVRGSAGARAQSVP